MSGNCPMVSSGVTLKHYSYSSKWDQTNTVMFAAFTHIKSEKR